MSDRKNGETAPPGGGQGSETGRFSELEELQREIERRIKDNQRFLEHFLDEDFPEGEEDAVAEEGDDGEEFEEL